MKISAQDVNINGYVLSENGLAIGYFGYDGEEEEDTNYTVETVEEFLGDSPIPVYLGQKYSEKLKLELSMVKNPCIFSDPYFTEFEIRGMLRQVLGQRGYIWLDLIAENPMEDISYQVRVEDVKYQKIQGKVAGIVLSMSCSSQFGVGREQHITLEIGENVPFSLYVPINDDIHNYILPTVRFIPTTGGTWTLENKTDKPWGATSGYKTIFNHAGAREILTFDCEKEIITSNLESHKYLLDDFNLKWPRLVSPKNEYVSSLAGSIEFIYRPKIRAGFVAV